MKFSIFDIMLFSSQIFEGTLAQGAAASRRRTHAKRALACSQIFEPSATNGEAFASSGGGTPPLLAQASFSPISGYYVSNQGMA
jgi:hypothetical protein